MMNIQTDYSQVDSILIAYPEGFRNEFEELVPFYDKLITKIPFDINLLIFVNNKSTREKLKVKFEDRKIEIILAEDWNDIWLRDIMGITIGNTMAKSIYDSTYCNYLKKNRNFIKINNHAETIMRNHLNKRVIKLPIKLDGGNLILNRKYAFITKKVFTDNTDLKEEELLNLLNDKLGLTPIIVPINRGDSLGHIDGYMAFIDEGTIAISEYPKMEIFKSDISYLGELNKYCEELNLRIVKIQERPTNQTIPCQCDMSCKKSFCSYTATGNYINFLRINKTIILPEYTLPTLKETIYYNNINEEILSNLGFQVIKINCDKLSQHGGSLRCLSYTCKLQ